MHKELELCSKLLPSRRKFAFTLIELLIATSILTALIVAVVGAFKSGADGFTVGQWKSNAQKKAQQFLLRLRDVIEKSNNAEAVLQNGNVLTASMPLRINSLYWNTTGTGNIRALILSCAICKPYVQGNNSLATSEQRGQWSAVTLYASNGNLVLKKSNNVDDANVPFPAGLMIPPSIAGVPRFDPAPNAECFVTILENVSTISIFRRDRDNAAANAVATDSQVLEITIVLSRPPGFGSRISTTITESIKAKLIQPNRAIEVF